MICGMSYFDSSMITRLGTRSLTEPPIIPLVTYGKLYAGYFVLPQSLAKAKNEVMGISGHVNGSVGITRTDCPQGFSQDKICSNGCSLRTGTISEFLADRIRILHYNRSRIRYLPDKLTWCFTTLEQYASFGFRSDLLVVHFNRHQASQFLSG